MCGQCRLYWLRSIFEYVSIAMFFYPCVSMDKKHDYKNVNPQIAVHAGTGRCIIFLKELSAMWEKRTQLYNYTILKDI